MPTLCVDQLPDPHQAEWKEWTEDYQPGIRVREVNGKCFIVDPDKEPDHGKTRSPTQAASNPAGPHTSAHQPTHNTVETALYSAAPHCSTFTSRLPI